MTETPDHLRRRQRRYQVFLVFVLLAAIVVAFFAIADVVSLTPVTWDTVGGAAIAMLLIWMVERL